MFRVNDNSAPPLHTVYRHELAWVGGMLLAHPGLLASIYAILHTDSIISSSIGHSRTRIEFVFLLYLH